MEGWHEWCKSVIWLEETGGDKQCHYKSKVKYGDDSAFFFSRFPSAVLPHEPHPTFRQAANAQAILTAWDAFHCLSLGHSPLSLGSKVYLRYNIGSQSYAGTPYPLPCTSSQRLGKNGIS